MRHHFIQHLSVREDYNVGQFEEDAIQKLEDLFTKKDKVILVGGSGLYIDSICKGFDKMPDISAYIREKVIEMYQKKGVEFLQKEVKEKDPVFYNKVDKND